MNDFIRTLVVTTFVVLLGMVLVTPVLGATTQVHVVKYASDKTTILAEQTLTYQEMEATLPVMGDGITHYYLQGPCFVDDPDPAIEEQLRWNAAEDCNCYEKDHGALKGTNVKDLCDLVGGMDPGDTVVIKAIDGWNMDFAYKNVYEYSDREGPMVLVWWSNGAAEHPSSGYTGPDFSEGMRLYWFADTSVNPWGLHIFGSWDWHEAAASEYWYYFYSSGEFYPTTTGLSGKYISEIKIYSNEPVPSVAQFSAVPLTGYSPLNVQFTDKSTGTDILTWSWDFQNDGVIDSEERNPFFVYDSPGIYTVNLTITFAAGTDSEVKPEYITVNDPTHVPPIAMFSADQTLGELPLTVHFTDSSTLNPTSWSWDFGDGTSSTLQNPEHTYSAEGSYTVSLTATNDYGSDSEMKANYITARSLLWGPYLTGSNTTSTTVNVKTYDMSSITVEYATDVYYQAHSGYDMTATDGENTQLHHIALMGLTPDTLYHYRVMYDGEATDDLHFRTFPESGPFTFVIYSDTQDQPGYSQLERHKLVADRIAEEENVLFVLNSGDLVNDASDMENWDRYFAAGSTMMTTIPVFPAQGNHDNNDPNYFDNYGMQANYSFDCADAHFTVLDSNTWADVSGQGMWLADDLQTDKPFRFVSFHYPPYSSDSKHFGGWLNIRDEWGDELTEGEVMAVFNGHVHAYERFLVDGIQYFVSGTGGGPSYNLAIPRSEYSQNSLEYVLAYLRVRVDPDTGTATADLIRVADISPDLHSITTLYPPNAIFETVVMTLNTPPILDSMVATMEPTPINSEITVNAYFRDPSDTHTAIFDWGDGTSSEGVVDEQTGTVTYGSVTGAHIYSQPGLYSVSLVLTDRWGETATINYQYVIIYDSDGGQVNGGGIIQVTAGDWHYNPDSSGKASFSLNGKYNKGIPSGNINLIFMDAKTQFKAEYLDYVVIENGTAYLHGYASIDKSSPDSEFMLVVQDGKITGGEDTYRLQVWDNLGQNKIFDNAPEAGDRINPDAVPISGGSIVIQVK